MKYCPRKGCNRAGADIERCNNFALKCPSPVDVEPAKVAVIRCRECNLTRAVPVGDIVRGRTRLVRTCPVTECKAVLLPQEKPTAAKKAPARGKGS